jgi:hypothetical protein
MTNGVAITNSRRRLLALCDTPVVGDESESLNPFKLVETGD